MKTKTIVVYFIVLFFGVIQAKAELILFEHYNTGNDDWRIFHGTAVGGWTGQTFTVETSHIIKSVRLRLHRKGLPGTMIVSIKDTDQNGAPIGPDLSSGTYDGDSLSINTNGIWTEIFLGDGVLLNASKKYAITARAPYGEGYEIDRVGWAGDWSNPTYKGGEACYSQDNNISWVMDGDIKEMMFEEWGIIPEPSSLILLSMAVIILLIFYWKKQLG